MVRNSGSGIYLSQFKDMDDGAEIIEEIADSNLKYIDIDEFKNLELEQETLEYLEDNDYKGIISVNSSSGNYVLDFEKVSYGKNEYYEFVIFKAKKYIFESPIHFSVIDNMIVYFVNNDRDTLELIEDEDIIDGLIENLNVNNDDNDNRTKGKLELIDISEFRKLKMDYSIYECLQDENYQNNFKFDSNSGNYSLQFKKMVYDKNEFYEYVIFKALNYLFDETDDFPIIDNMLLYFVEDDQKTLKLVEHEEIVTDIIDEYYSGLELEETENQDVTESDDANTDTEVECNEFIPFEETENAVDKLMTENYSETIIVKNHSGEKMMMKRIGGIVYKKKEYIVVKIFQKTSEILNKYIVYSVSSTALSTVTNTRLSKKIMKLCSKKYKIDLV